ncbi:MAG TPA: glycosyltransferase [Polyangiaceae bacterium]
MTTVCLAVMAKDEAAVLERCLASARPLVDAWLLLDTGSTDATAAIAERTMEGLPGEVVHRPWRDFAESRTESFELARSRGDYVLFLDADDRLEYPPGARFPELTEPAYALLIHDGSLEYPRVQLVKSDLPWRFEGVRHEHAVCDGLGRPALLDGIVYRRIGGGARSNDPDKYRKDAAELEADLRRDPTNARTVFYVARSYEDAGDLPRALAHYERRLLMGGWDEELFYAAYRLGRVKEGLGFPHDQVAEVYARAWHLRPQRAEPLFELARLCREDGNWGRARAYAAAAAAIPKPRGEVIFLHADVYDWRALNEYAGASAQVGDFAGAAEACRQLLAGGRLPLAERGRVEANLAWCLRSGNAKT